MKLVIGYDGSQCAEAAIGDLRYAGIPDGSEATVLSVGDLVVETPYAGLDPSLAAPRADVPYSPAAVVTQARAAAAAVMAEARQASVNGADLVRSLFPRWTVHADAVADSPYWALVERAGAWSADLIVVGSQGRSAFGRLILGSVSQNVLHYAPCSVRIGRCPTPVPATGATGGVRLLLGVDGSPDSAVAVSAVASRAWPAGTEVLVLTALDPRLSGSVAWLGTWAERAADGQDVATLLRQRVDGVADELRDAGLAVTPAVTEGDPKQILIAEAQRWDAHCIFLGARGHTRAERILLGSVSAAVAARAHCSVEIVRAPVT